MVNRLTRMFTGKWTPLAVASVTAVSVLAVPGAALGAGTHPSDADFGYSYNSDTQEIGFWFDLGDGEVDCAWTDDVIDESELNGVDDTESRCIVVDIAGPNGQVNHGTIVSAFVHGLKDVIDVSGYDGPRGRLVSEVARGDDGKGGDKVKANPDTDTNAETDSDSDGHGPPAWVKEKKEKKGDHGPPAWVKEKKASRTERSGGNGGHG